MTPADQLVRRGLPRTAGGPPWPVVSVAAVEPMSLVAAAAPSTAAAEPVVSVPEAHVPAPVKDVPAAVIALSDGIRRGLPRVAGGAPWPVASTTPAVAAANEAFGQDPAPAAVPPVPEAASVSQAKPAAAPEVALPAEKAPAIGASERDPAPAASPAPPRPQPVAQEPLPATKLSRRQRVGVFVVCAFALFGLASAVVLAARWLVGLDPVAAFVARYPGEYELPHGAPTGLPAWLGWQHFFNLFFLVLIVRSGLQVRHQQRPPAYWASKRNPERKISLTLWFHQSLDVLWLANGVVFVILLFATGQWMRIVPTSWEVFPNALSAGLQYLTLNWPVENGWINYNGLQQLAYFLTVFIAAPLAVASGVRMSGFWPKDNARLSAAYPVEVARALHFPVMLYFVGFTVIHVTLVLTTGALRNLNHMYGARDEVSWYGAIMLLVSLAVIAGSVVAARPLVLAPIARMMGHVSAR